MEQLDPLLEVKQAQLEEKKLQPPSAIGFSLDWDSSGDVLIKDHKDYLLKRAAYCRLIALLAGQDVPDNVSHLLPSGIDPKNVYGYTGSARQSLKLEVENYKQNRTLSFQAFINFFKRARFNFNKLLYKDVEEIQKQTKGWYIGQAMDEAIEYCNKNSNSLLQVNLKELSDCKSYTKGPMLAAQLKNFAEQIKNKNSTNTPCPFYFIDDKSEEIEEVTKYFNTQPEKIPPGVELHIIRDDQQRYYCGKFEYQNILTSQGLRIPTKEEIILKEKVLRCLKKPVAELKVPKHEITIQKHPLTSAILNPSTSVDFNKLIADMDKEEVNFTFYDPQSGPDFKYKYGTPLILAIRAKNQKAITALLESEKIDVNTDMVDDNYANNEKQHTPLTEALRSKDESLIDTLLSPIQQ